MLTELNFLESDKPKKGDVLVIRTKKSGKQKLLVMVKDVVNDNEITLQMSTNSYFMWDLYQNGESWVWRVWNLGQVTPTTSVSNINQLLNY